MRAKTISIDMELCGVEMYISGVCYDNGDIDDLCVEVDGKSVDFEALFSEWALRKIVEELEEAYGDSKVRDEE